MSANLRGTTVVWNNVVTGANGTSAAAYVGQSTSVAVLIQVNGATNITLQTCEPAGGVAGINADVVNLQYFDMLKPDGTAVITLAFAGSGAQALDLSPFAPAYIRLKSSSSVTATGMIVSNG